MIPEDGFTTCRRRNQNNSVKLDSKGEFVVDNRHIIPHNKGLRVKFQCHINLKLCNKTRAIKYLFKYVTKGPDRAKVLLEDGATCHLEQRQGMVKHVDEIQTYLDCKYISVHEAYWRIYGFEIHYRHPTVQRLCIHLPRQQNI